MDLENYTNVNIFKKVYENREVSQASHVIEQPHHENKSSRQHAQGFNPYVNNQGTTLGKYINKQSLHKVFAHLLTNILFFSYCW